MSNQIKLRTYEEIVAENPNAIFLVDDGDYVATDLIEELECEIEGNNSREIPEVHLMRKEVMTISASLVLEDITEQLQEDADVEWECPFGEEDEAKLQKCLDEIIAGHASTCVTYHKQQQINIDDLWERLKNEKTIA